MSLEDMRDPKARNDHVGVRTEEALSDSARYCKWVFNGSGGVGKTSFLYRLLFDLFPEEYVPTVLDNYVLPIRPGAGALLGVGFWDIQGGRDGTGDFDRRLRPLQYPGTSVMFLIVDCSRRESLVDVEDLWLPQTLKHVPKALRVLLVTKIDLRDDETVVAQLAKRGETFISTEEAADWGRKHGCALVLEVSAKRGDNVTTFLQSIVELELAEEKRASAPSSSSIGRFFRRLFSKKAEGGGVAVDPNPPFSL
jgi:small GTP-binding protein